MKKILIIFLFCLAIMFNSSYAANTITRSPSVGAGVINLVLDSDWTWSTTFPDAKDGIEVNYIIFHPGATSDVLVLRAESDTGPYYFPPAAAYDAEFDIILYCNWQSMKLHIDYDTSTLSAGHVIIIQFR